MGGEGSGRKPDPIKQLRAQQNNSISPSLAGNLILPNLSGISSHPEAKAAFELWKKSGDNIYFDTGKVGIGTTTFGGVLNVADSSDCVSFITATNANGNAYFFLNQPESSFSFGNFDEVFKIRAGFLGDEDTITVSSAGAIAFPKLTTAGFVKNDASGNITGGNSALTSGSEVDHADLVNTHNLTTDINHNSITNAHNLTTDIDHNSITNTHNLTTDIDHNQLTNYVAAEHVNWSTYLSSLSGSFNSVSGSVLQNASNIVSLSGSVSSLSGSFWTHRLSGSDPHGTLLTQTNISFTSGSRTGDFTASGSAYVPNVMYGTDATPPSASTVPIGTIYFQHN